MAHITAPKLYLVLIYLILMPNVDSTMMIVYSTFSYLVHDNTRHFQKLNENLNVVTFPSTTGYLMPLRAINTAGKWRIVVNGVKAHYETLTQVQSVNSTTQKFDTSFIFSDGSSGGVLNPWLPMSSCSSLL